jgi:hypothetical protein
MSRRLYLANLLVSESSSRKQAEFEPCSHAHVVDQHGAKADDAGPSAPADAGVNNAIRAALKQFCG